MILAFPTIRFPTYPFPQWRPFGGVAYVGPLTTMLPILSTQLRQLSVSLANISFQSVPDSWDVYLENSSGTRYSLGQILQGEDPQRIEVPLTVPDGTYVVWLYTNGELWEGLDQKPFATVRIARSESVAISTYLPEFTDLAYEYDDGQMKLTWNGEIPQEDAGLVFAGIWLSDTIPNFGTDPDLIVPVFSFETMHSYTLWNGTSYEYAGVASMDTAGLKGEGIYIALPTDAVVTPPVEITASS